VTNNRNVTNKYDEERLRAAEQSQVVYLQNQIDEFRRLLKEQSNKYSLAMEQVRKVESSVAQIDGLIERQRGEVAQSIDSSRREIAALRREVANALVKAEESARPIREMQAQIQQIAEARKQDRDQVSGWLGRIEDLDQRIAVWSAQIHDTDERYRGLAKQIEGTSTADEAIRNDVRKLAEDMQVERQSLRRQAIEAQQMVTDLQPTLDGYNSRIDRLDEIRQRIDLFAEQLPIQITELDIRITEQVGEVRRVERVVTERFLMNQERLEEVRQQQENKISTLQEADDLHLRQVTAWLERLDAWIRELEQRQAKLLMRFEQSEREQSVYLNDLDHRTISLIEAILRTMRGQIETIKAEQVDRGRIMPENS
jgi:chromosome segregation ATPase